MTDKPKFYDLMMFPYPSGSAMHVGHASNYLYSEIVARYKRMRGYDVVFPLGYDSFGLPTENFAIKNNKSARQATEENIAYFDEQVEAMDFSLDKGRMFKTSDPEYYKWTQRIFSKLFEHGLVYRKDGPVNRCPSCQTVLANDQIVDGKCERCESEVVQKQMPQWYIKITDYAEQLLDYSDCDRPEETITHQKNWIGKSEGAEIDFDIIKNIQKSQSISDSCESSATSKITVFTTRPDTLFGVTAIVLAPENQTIDNLLDANKTEELKKFRAEVAKMNSIDRQSTDRSKNGMFSDVYAKHPFTGEKIPLWYGDYVLPDYATGAVMFVPAHDERDWEFAKKYDMEVKQVVASNLVGEGDQAPRDDVETLDRIVIDAIIENNKGEFLLEKDSHWHFVGGGIEDGDTAEETVHKEIFEETGYKNIHIERRILDYSFMYAYRLPKNKNQRTNSIWYHIKLLNDEKVYSEADEGKHILEWVKKEDVEKKLERPHHIISWQVFNKGAYTGPGKLVNSGQFDGLDNTEAKKTITTELEKLGLGRKKITYRLRDWSVSRQRYWGSPIPIYYTFEDNQKVPYYSSRDYYEESVGNWLRPDKPVKTRHNAKVIIKHRSEDKYLLLYNDVFKYHLVGGGVEDGESVVETAIREAKEETPYSNFTLISESDLEIHNDFYQPNKQENRYLIESFVVLQCENDSISGVKLEQHESFDHHRINAEDIGNHINYPNEQHGWYFYYNKTKIKPHKITDLYNAYNPHPDKTKWIPHLIPESELPVILPLDLPNYKPAGKSPLEDHPSFKYYRPSETSKSSDDFRSATISENSTEEVYLRECDTLDTFMCSSFYYLRFLDPHNSDYLISDDICERYMPVDLYIGGKEHTVGHLLYSRFIYKFLKDKGYITNDSKEPFHKLVHQGMVHAHDGRKMSKRRGNVIDPMDIIKEYGSDTLRTYIMFMGPIELNKNRNPDAVAGVKRFLDRVERGIDFVSDVDDKDVDSLTQQTIKGVTEDIDLLKFNTAISKIMILTNGIYDHKSISRSNFESLLLLLSPFASKLTQKLRIELGNDGEISKQTRPVRDENKIASSSIDLPIQVNGKMRGAIEVSPDISQEEAIKLVTSDERFTKYITGGIKKVIWVPGKICNIIT